MITTIMTPPSPDELGDEWQRVGSPFHQHPSNHRLQPGGREYWTRYAFVRGQVEPGAKVLDVGCNCGQLAKNLTAQLGCEVWGVDLIADFVKTCRTCREAEQLGQFFVADFGALTADELVANDLCGFDVVTALEVIEHPLDLNGFRRNVAHVLRPGGRLIVTTPHGDHPAFGWSYCAHNPHHVMVWTREKLVNFFGMYDIYAELWDPEGGPHIAAAWTVGKERGLSWHNS